MFTWIWVFLLSSWKNNNIIFKIKRSKVTDYAALRPEGFISRFANPPTVIFCKVEKKILKLFLYFICRLLILFVSLKKNLRFCLFIFESETGKIDCPVQIFRKMLTYLKIYYILLFYLTCFTVFLEIINKKNKKKKEKKRKKKNKLWKWTVNWSFSELFYFIYFSSPDPKSEKKTPVNQLRKKSGLMHQNSFFSYWTTNGQW